MALVGLPIEDEVGWDPKPVWMGMQKRKFACRSFILCSSYLCLSVYRNFVCPPTKLYTFPYLYHTHIQLPGFPPFPHTLHCSSLYSFLYSECGGIQFLYNRTFLPDYTVSHHRRKRVIFIVTAMLTLYLVYKDRTCPIRSWLFCSTSAYVLRNSFICLRWASSTS